MDPFGYHLTNVILHVTNAGLMYALTLQLIGAVDRLEPGPPSRGRGPCCRWRRRARVCAASAARRVRRLGH